MHGGLPFSSHSTGAVVLCEVQLTSARAQPGLAPPASWVETCSCPQGYTGQFCELCALGYKREIPRGGPYTSCVPCTCNQHGTCDPSTGESRNPIPRPPQLYVQHSMMMSLAVTSGSWGHRLWSVLAVLPGLLLSGAQVPETSTICGGLQVSVYSFPAGVCLQPSCRCLSTARGQAWEGLLGALLLGRCYDERQRDYQHRR